MTALLNMRLTSDHVLTQRIEYLGLMCKVNELSVPDTYPREQNLGFAIIFE